MDNDGNDYRTYRSDLRSVLEKENVDIKGMLMDDKYFTTLAFVEVSESGERTFAFSRKPGADT